MHSPAVLGQLAGRRRGGRHGKLQRVAPARHLGQVEVVVAVVLHLPGGVPGVEPCLLGALPAVRLVERPRRVHRPGGHPGRHAVACHLKEPPLRRREADGRDEGVVVARAEVDHRQARRRRCLLLTADRRGGGLLLMWFEVADAEDAGDLGYAGCDEAADTGSSSVQSSELGVSVEGGGGSRYRWRHGGRRRMESWCGIVDASACLAWRPGRRGGVPLVLNYSVLAGMDDLGVGAMRTGLKSLHWMTMFVKCTQGDMDGQTKQNH